MSTFGFMPLPTQGRYPLQARTMQGIESSCPLLKKNFGKNYCQCPLLKKLIKNKYFSCLLFLTATTQHFRCQTENFQGCDLPLQKSKRQSDLWEFFAFFPISCLMLLILTHSTPLKREFPHICKSESKFLNFAVAFTSYKLAFTFASEQKQANFSMKFTCRRYSPQFSGQR